MAICPIVMAGHLDSDVSGPGMETILKDNILEKASQVGYLNIYLNYINMTDISSYLISPGTYTVFAPKDSAFSKLSIKEVQLILNDTSNLSITMGYTVARGNYTTENLKKMKFIETINGVELPIDSSSGLNINGSTVTQSDIICSNGIIHVMDSLIIPPSKAYEKKAIAVSSNGSVPNNNVGNPIAENSSIAMSSPGLISTSPEHRASIDVRQELPPSSYPLLGNATP